jgi:hypothetical protein
MREPTRVQVSRTDHYREAVMGAAVAAVVTMTEDRHVVDQFRAASATSPDHARSLEALGLARRGSVLSLIRRRRLREAAPGLFYLDEAAKPPVHLAQPTLTVLVALLLGCLAGLMGRTAR